ncbi:MAG: GNAT family N-acetyltransferase [Clostridia bacterium]
MDSLRRGSLIIKQIIREITIKDLEYEKFKIYDRYQVTRKKVEIKDNKRIVKDIYFINKWTEEQIKSLVEELKKDLLKDGFIIGAFEGEQVIAFAGIRKGFFGNKHQYLQMPYMHVSKQFRGLGIGKKLFYICVEKAKEMRADKIYISSHPAIETQKFYESVGCILADEVNQQLKKLEPHDIHLEYCLK